MHALAWPDTLEVGPGESAFLSVAVTNSSDVIDAYSVTVFGLDPAWVDVSPDRLSLFPGETGNLGINLQLPEDYPSSHRMIAVSVLSRQDSSDFSMSQVALTVRPAAETSVGLDPSMVTGGRRATFGLIVSNSGNAVVTATATALDPEDLAEFRFDPPNVLVPPGRDQVIRVTATGGRSWFGQPRARTFQLGVDAESHVEAPATFIQRPRIPRWMLSLLALLTAAAVFAFVLSSAFGEVVEEAKVTDEIIEAALATGEAGGAVVPTNPGTVRGMIATASITATSEGNAGPAGLSGVTVELYVAEDTTTPLASAATDAEGAFTLANLSGGDYLLQLSGAGISTVWYSCDIALPEPDQQPVPGTACDVNPVVDPTDAGTISVGLGVVTELPSLTVPGEPVTLSGVLGIADPAGAQVTLISPGVVRSDESSAPGGSTEGSGDTLPSSGARGPRQAEPVSATTPTAGAVVATASVGVDGSFELADVPTPGTYELVVEQPGFEPAVQTVELGPGEGLGDMEILLQPATGTITGTIEGPTGPVGGATVTATDGTATFETVSLTTVGEEGTFRLRNLAVPGQYTVTATGEGFSTATQSVALRAASPAADIRIQLLSSTGSISGRVTLEGAPGRGLQVEVNGPDTQRFTDIASTGLDAGTYTVDGLTSPGTYTLEFSGSGVLPQARVESIDPGSPTSNDLTGVDADLRRSTTVLRGEVTREDPANPALQIPAPGATVELKSGAETWTVAAVHAGDGQSAGSFAIAGLPPGAYTLSATLEGTERAVELVDIVPGAAPPPQTLALGAQASINVTVVRKGVPSPVNVRLYELVDFPVKSIDEKNTTATSDTVRFEGLNAPREYVIAVFSSSGGDDPLNSTTTVTRPGRAVDVKIRVSP